MVVGADTSCGNRGARISTLERSRVSIHTPPTRVRVWKARWLRNEIQQPAVSLNPSLLCTSHMTLGRFLEL